MSAQLLCHSYGKSRVRFSRIIRAAGRHEFLEATASIALEGDFAAAYTHQDNRLVIPTDTMKNTVYVLAQKHGVSSIESFALRLGQHFLEAYPHVTQAKIALDERPWIRLKIENREHEHSFLSAGAERYRCEVASRRGDDTLRSGLSGLQLLKTTGSAFTGFYKDDLTALKETDDRIFATTVEAWWPCNDHAADWSSARRSIRAAMLRVFAAHHSPSVQATLYQMALAAFEACPLIDEISIAMPNQHHLLVDLRPFGLVNENETFAPCDEPHGQISATVQRSDTRTTR